MRQNKLWNGFWKTEQQNIIYNIDFTDIIRYF